MKVSGYGGRSGCDPKGVLVPNPAKFTLKPPSPAASTLVRPLANVASGRQPSHPYLYQPRWAAGVWGETGRAAPRSSSKVKDEQVKGLRSRGGGGQAGERWKKGKNAIFGQERRRGVRQSVGSVEKHIKINQLSRLICDTRWVVNAIPSHHGNE